MADWYDLRRNEWDESESEEDPEVEAGRLAEEVRRIDAEAADLRAWEARRAAETVEPYPDTDSDEPPF